MEVMADHVHFRQYNKTYRIDFIRKLVSNLKAQKEFQSSRAGTDTQRCGDNKYQDTKESERFLPSCNMFFSSIPTEKTGREVGIDFGIEHNLTLSNGQTFDIYVPESKGVKLASKRQNKAYRRINETEKRRQILFQEIGTSV